MIRINLLAIERERTAKRFVLSEAHRVTIAASLILIGTALVVGWWFWSLRQQSLQLDADLASAEAQSVKIRPVLEQVRKFEAQKAMLQQRVTLIEELRKGQSSPVHILDEISRSLPDRVWLRELSQVQGDFTITGVTDSMTAVSDFVANLENTRWFRKPVEIVDSQVQTDAKAGDLIRFQVKAQSVDPNADQKPAAVARR
jgi:type IV pilus assembly protein PilN